MTSTFLTLLSSHFTIPLYNISVKPILNVSQGFNVYGVFGGIFVPFIFVPFVDFKSIISSVVARSNRIRAWLDETSLSFESDIPFFFILSLRPISHFFSF